MLVLVNRLGVVLPVPAAGLVPVLPGAAAGLVCGSTCQLPAWCCAGGASCRLGVVLPVPAAG
ncbi:hypothetical protein PR001_g25704 [Phytophthora rubi]|uniref:Secreted protein n=1 Tax=Phytophthora rubi TaxID=129364 RepID=A0A6A3HXM5_9STRA|nr:hypothetical protein PR001_g25704 [Phytophthora rubi]